MTTWGAVSSANCPSFSLLLVSGGPKKIPLRASARDAEGEGEGDSAGDACRESV